jgi:hypothetical protein
LATKVAFTAKADAVRAYDARNKEKVECRREVTGLSSAGRPGTPRDGRFPTPISGIGLRLVLTTSVAFRKDSVIF